MDKEKSGINVKYRKKRWLGNSTPFWPNHDIWDTRVWDSEDLNYYQWLFAQW